VATTASGLPSVAEIDAADDKLGEFLSDLDWFTSSAARLAGPAVPLADAVFMCKAGIAFSDRVPFEYDEASFARLLVFANEIETDAERTKEDAAKLRAALLSIYREHVIEGHSDDEGGEGDAS
jgi:hypothetical protein